MLIWDKLSAEYNTLCVQKYVLEPTRAKALALLKPRTEAFSLLDVGCATGQLLNQIKAKYPKANLVGIDKSSKMIEIAKSTNNLIHYTQTTAEEFETGDTFDFIMCCNSFPYHGDKDLVLKKTAQLLKDDGTAIFIQVSVSNCYDRVLMYFVEKMLEKAEYLSKNDFCRMAEKYFVVEDVFTIKEKFCVPNIGGFVLRKK